MYNISRTDVQCQWKKPKKTNDATKKWMAEMYPASKPGYVALTRKPIAEDRAQLKN
jgi:catalase